MIAVLIVAPIGGTLIKPEARRRTYRTKVSIQTKASVGHCCQEGASLSHSRILLVLLVVVHLEQTPPTTCCFADPLSHRGTPVPVAPSRSLAWSLGLKSPESEMRFFSFIALKEFSGLATVPLRSRQTTSTTMEANDEY